MKNRPQTHTRIAHETHTRMAQNTHTDCTQTHTYFYRWSFSPLKHGRKHTHTWNENRFFSGMGAPATINIFAFLAHPGRPRHCKIRYFWHPGNTFTNNSHTHLPPGAPQTRKNTYIWPPGAPRTCKTTYFGPQGRPRQVKNTYIWFPGAPPDT